MISFIRIIRILIIVCTAALPHHIVSAGFIPGFFDIIVSVIRIVFVVIIPVVIVPVVILITSFIFTGVFLPVIAIIFIILIGVSIIFFIIIFSVIPMLILVPVIFTITVRIFPRSSRRHPDECRLIPSCASRYFTTMMGGGCGETVLSYAFHMYFHRHTIL